MILRTWVKYDVGSVCEIEVSPTITMRYQIIAEVEALNWGSYTYKIEPAKDTFINETRDIGDCE